MSETRPCFSKKFTRKEFKTLKPTDLVTEELNDEDIVEIVVRRTKRKASANGHSNGTHSSLIDINGFDMTLDTLMTIGKGDSQLSLSESTMAKLRKTRDIVEKIIDEGHVRYGISTGFGSLSKVVVDKDNLVELQYNIIRSHCAGIGKPISLEATRRMLALRINVLAKAFSGCSPGLVSYMVEMFNKNCLPLIPCQGTVGASGDLAPLSHLAQGIIGEGKMWSPSTGWGKAAEVLAANGLSPYELQPKDGLSLVNGTQFICAIGSEALYRAKHCARTAVVIAALALDVLEGHVDAMDARVHAIRPHSGQGRIAATFRALSHSAQYPSEVYLMEKHDVQDPYTIRCSPQVMGITLDTIKFVEGIIGTELNSATDNPLVFGDSEASKADIISAGNFHGEYPAKALDYLTIAVHELGNMSERRLERMCNPACSGTLPAFLVQGAGLNSGFMMAHVTSAALVSENKTLCFPSSADTLSTSAGKEDHVSMGGWSARKALKVVENLENVLAIELMAACQALEFRRPQLTTKPLEAVYKLVRTKVAPYDKDRAFTEDVEALQAMIERNEIWEAVAPFLAEDPLWD